MSNLEWFKTGDRVYVRGSQKTGTVASHLGSIVEVDVDGLSRLRFAAEALTRIDSVQPKLPKAEIDALAKEMAAAGAGQPVHNQDGVVGQTRPRVEVRVGDWARCEKYGDEYRVDSINALFASGVLNGVRTTWRTDMLTVLRRPLRVGDEVIETGYTSRYPVTLLGLHKGVVAGKIKREHCTGEIVLCKAHGWLHANGLPIDVEQTLAEQKPVAKVGRAISAPPGSKANLTEVVAAVLKTLASEGAACIRHEVEVTTKRPGTVGVEVKLTGQDTYAADMRELQEDERRAGEAKRWWRTDPRVIAFIEEKSDRTRREVHVIPHASEAGFRNKSTISIREYKTPIIDERYCKAEQTAWDRDEPKLDIDGVMVGARTHYEGRVG